MPVTHQISPEKEVLVWIFSGKLENDELIEALSTAAQDPHYDADHQVVLIACPDVDPSEITASMIKEIATTAVAKLDRDASFRTTRQAIICPDGIVKIFMGFFAAMCESNSQYSAEYKHCATLSEAENWIERDLSGLEVVDMALNNQYAKINETINAIDQARQTSPIL